ACRERYMHVGEVAVAEVELGRTPRSFDQDELELGKQRAQTLLDDRPQKWRTFAPGNLREGEVGDPRDDHLAGRLALGLDEHRVHAYIRLEPRGARLQVLGDADLAAGHDARVVRHVLRLERSDVDATPCEEAAERRDEQALACRARGTLDGERAHPRVNRSR